jgi:hypothetical protein
LVVLPRANLRGNLKSAGRRVREHAMGVGSLAQP